MILDLLRLCIESELYKLVGLALAISEDCFPLGELFFVYSVWLGVRCAKEARVKINKDRLELLNL